jgi:hypothetical protein
MAYQLVRLTSINQVANLPAGTQIAVKRSIRDFNPLFARFLYPLVFGKMYYYHHGVYVGHGQVVHFHGENKANAKPRECHIEEFRSGSEDDEAIFKVVYGNEVTVLPVDDTVNMAKEMAEDPQMWKKYNVMVNNCETFATWLKTGVKDSAQATEGMQYILIITCTLCVLYILLILSIICSKFKRLTRRR